MIVIPRNRVWREPPKAMGPGSGVKEKVRFAGEQEISTALVVLTSQRRPTVTFVRSGGPPVTAQIENDQISYTGQYFAVAEKLREYNFEVLEKDLTEQWMQQEMQMRMQMPDLHVSPEATKEQLDHSVWIVQPGPPASPRPGEPPSSIGASLSEHLASGGSAMVLLNPGDDDLAAVLSPLGIAAHTDLLAIHSAPPEVEGRVNDQVDEWRREQYVWVLNEFGSHPITAGLEKLDLMVLPALPIVTTDTKGVTAARLLPLTDGSQQVWATPVRRYRPGGARSYDAAIDMASPLYAGAAIEKTSGDAGHSVSRMVVLGGANVPKDQWVTVREHQVQRGGSNALRFPANTELFTNSIFWLSKMEKMMNIVPASRDVALIGPMSGGVLAFWRTFVLAFIPLIALFCGARIYFLRRD